jgi:sulfide:quinone oxidoreductase
MMKKVLVLGGNFGGMTAALQVVKKAKGKAEVTVVSPSKYFIYTPSQIWVPFGIRKLDDIRFESEAIFKKNGVNFIQDAAINIDVKNQLVSTNEHGDIAYDYLVIATGVSLNFNIVENFDPAKGYINDIVIPQNSAKTYENYLEFLKDPGPIVVGATQEASCMGAGYEYLFNMEKELRRNKISRDLAPLTWITPEPQLGNFGIDGIRGGETMLKAFMKMFKINYVTDSSIKTIESDKITLDDGKEIPYKFAMLIPPFEGADVIKKSKNLGNEKGFIVCDDGYQSVDHKNIYAAGMAVQVDAASKGKVPFGVPKTGYPTDVMGKIAAHNILHDMGIVAKRKEKAFGRIPGLCVMDCGDKEVYILSTSLLKPRAIAIMFPNIFCDLGKWSLEKYFLFKNKHGFSSWI